MILVLTSPAKWLAGWANLLFFLEELLTYFLLCFSVVQAYNYKHQSGVGNTTQWPKAAVTGQGEKCFPRGRVTAGKN